MNISSQNTLTIIEKMISANMKKELSQKRDSITKYVPKELLHEEDYNIVDLIDNYLKYTKN